MERSLVLYRARARLAALQMLLDVQAVDQVQLAVDIGG
jgi:hypothetical protein